MPLGMEVGLGPRDFVFDGDQATPEQRVRPPPASFGHVYCGQTAGWMKTPLGTEVDLGSVHIFLDGDLAPHAREKGTAAPTLFGPCLLWPQSPISATDELLYKRSAKKFRYFTTNKITFITLLKVKANYMHLVCRVV